VRHRTLILVLAVVVSAALNVPVRGQRIGQPTLGGRPMLVVFRDDAPFGSFSAGQLDARARANPQAWGYLDRRVLGTVQTLEREQQFQADQVYSATVRGFAARLTPSQIEALRRDPLVAYIEPDTEMHELSQTLTWNIDRIDTDVSSTHAGDGFGAVPYVPVYILDDSVDRTHPDLNVVAQIDFTGTGATPTCAHGTRVAGVLGAKDDTFGVVGALPGASIVGVKVTTCDPVFLFASTVIKGIDWLTQNAMKPAVANMSIGGLANATLDTAVKRSADSGIFYAIAAGNNSGDACFFSPQRAGTYPGVMTVAATAPDDTEAFFSNYGACVDIWAPGVAIYTDDLGGGLVASNGTSYSAPHVAGTAGLYLATHPGSTPATIETALKADAVYPGTTSRNGTPIRIVYAGHY
jgi:subtilisin family serine protease